MKKMTYFVMALALVLGFTQCKKEQLPTNNASEGVFITLDVDGGNNGSRVIVDPNGNPAYATVTFEDGDVIYVGYKNAYVGQLTYNGTSFSGTIGATPDMENKEPLHFYFLGGKGFNTTVNGNTASVNISHQAVKYPVISYAPSNEEYIGAASYSAKLMNKCSIMKFIVTKPAESVSAICITGMNNKVTVNFNPNTAGTDEGFTYSMDGSGQIMMKGGTGESIETWAIVLPQGELAAGGDGTAYINDYEGTRPAIGIIGSNQYINDATRTIAIGDNPTGMLIGEFSVDGIRFHFSKGGLQYQASTGTWRFAENQWDYVGSGNANISPTYSGWIDLFGWGTGNNPTESSTNINNYPNFNDWGNNPISNGGNTANAWRTPIPNEFVYLDAIEFPATVNGVHGYIDVPNNFIDPMTNMGDHAFVETDDDDWGNWNYNIYSGDGWKSMEAVGAIFHPCAGYRDGTTVYSVGQDCCYWPSSEKPKQIFFNIGPENSRHYGLSVRLVKTVN